MLQHQIARLFRTSFCVERRVAICVHNLDKRCLVTHANAGHTFQVRPAGDRIGPRKDTVLVLPGATVDVDFDADNPGQWLTHCHNIYHGEAGMMTVVSYMAT